jgi:hypothetical protein
LRFPKYLLAFVLLVSKAALSAPDWHWYYYTLDSTAEYKGFSKILYNSKGDLCVAYRSNSKLMYGEFDGSRFSVSEADTAIVSESKIAFALDPDDKPHMIHHHWSYRRLQYAHYDGAKWIRFNADTLDHENLDFYQVSMLIQPDFTQHLVYTTSINGKNTLTYATYNKALERTYRYRFTTGIAAKWNSLALDADGRPVIAYYVYDKDGLVFSTKADTGWTEETVLKEPGKPQEGFMAGIVRVGEEGWRIVTQNRSGLQIQMASKDGGDSAWSFEKVDTLPGYTTFTVGSPFKIGKDGTYFVVAPKVVTEPDRSVSKAELHLAYKTDSAWETQPVDVEHMAGLYADMTLTPEGLPAISYYDPKTNALRLAVAKTTAPVDADNNGIPDYRENPIAFVGVLGRPKRPELLVPESMTSGKSFYNLSGRKVAPGRRAPTFLVIPAR